MTRSLRKLPQESPHQSLASQAAYSQKTDQRLRTGQIAKCLGTTLSKTLGASIASLVLALPRPSLAAEAINVTLKSISFDIPLADLELLADQGKVSANLGFVKAASKPGQIESLRALLQARFNLNSTALSQFLALPEGDVLLARLGSLIIDDGSFVGTDKRTNAELLQETILTASVHPDGLSLINIVRQYPRERLILDASQALELVSENSDFYIRRPETIRAIQGQANRDRLPTTRSFDDLTQPGPLGWRKQPLTFRTPDRPSFSFADLYIPQKTIPSFSDNGEPTNPQTPVVILSHGLGSNRLTLAYLAQHWASHGYAALVLEHNETSTDRFNRFLSGMASPPSARELILRPRDITAALDHLSQRAKTNPTLASLNLNLDSVGVAGQSLGGYTALAAGGATINRPQLNRYCPEELSRFTFNISIPLQCRVLDLPEETSLDNRDKRVTAVLAINPLTSQIFGRAGLETLDIPIMVVAGTHDYVAPALPEQLQPFQWLKTTHKYLVLVNNGTHFSFIGDDGSSEVVALPESVLGPSGKLVQPGLQAMGLAFFNRHLRGEATYDEYLNQNYADSLTRSPVDYSLVQSLPESISQSPNNEALLN